MDQNLCSKPNLMVIFFILKAKVPCPSLDIVNSELKPKGKNWWHLPVRARFNSSTELSASKTFPQQDMVTHSTQQPSFIQIFQQQIHNLGTFFWLNQRLGRNLYGSHFAVENWYSLILLKPLDLWTTGTNDRFTHQHPTTPPQRSWPFQRGALRDLESLRFPDVLFAWREGWPKIGFHFPKSSW